jgi:hypothetical protein
MVLAAVVAHLSARWKTAAEPLRYRNYLFIILGSLVLVLIGISVLPGAFAR